MSSGCDPLARRRPPRICARRCGTTAPCSRNCLPTATATKLTQPMARLRVNLSLKRPRLLLEIVVGAAAEGGCRDGRRKWTRVQTEFVDRPQEAVEEADRLVADLMQSVGCSVHADTCRT